MKMLFEEFAMKISAPVRYNGSDSNLIQDTEISHKSVKSIFCAKSSQLMII